MKLLLLGPWLRQPDVRRLSGGAGVEWSWEAAAGRSRQSRRWALGPLRVRRSASWTDDDPLDVVAGPVATDEALGELDRAHRWPWRRCPRPGARAFASAGPGSRPRECATGRARATRGPGRSGVVALGEQVVERAVLEVGREQARETSADRWTCSRRRGSPARDSQALHVERRRARLDPERLGDTLAGDSWPSRHEPRLRLQAAVRHLLGEAQRFPEVALDPRSEDGRPVAALPLQAALAGSSERARRTVIRLQPYRSASWRSGGRRSPGRHSPASSAARRSSRPGGEAGRDRARVGNGPS